VDVREAGASDWPAVEGLLAELGRPDVRGRDDEESHRVRFEEYLARPDTVALVAVDGGGVIGFVDLEFRQRLNFGVPEAWIPDLVVAEGARSRGAGKALLAAAEERSRAHGCFALELEWLLLDGLDRLQNPDGESLYFRLSTKPVDQTPFTAAVELFGEAQLRADVLAGGFRLREAGASPDRVLIATCGAMVSEALEAAEQLADEEGVEATVLCLSSPDRLYRDCQAAQSSPIRRGRTIGTPHLEQLLAPDEKGLPVVSVIDGSSHALAWIGSALAAELIVDARAAGITEINALVSSGNPAAAALLRRIANVFDIRFEGAELSIRAAIA